MKYRKADREAAARLCSALADWWARPGASAPHPFLSTSGHVIEELAIAANRVARVDFEPGVNANVRVAWGWAESEALIRTGWCPP